jgi:hypothetical protein
MKLGSKPCQDQFLYPILVQCRKIREKTGSQMGHIKNEERVISFLRNGFNLKNSSKAGADFTKLYFLISGVKLACLSQMEKNA